MNGKSMWKLQSWYEFVRDNPDVTDISYQINDHGEIPIECGRCKKKVSDDETKTRKVKGERIRDIYCTNCGWEGERILGKFRKRYGKT